jgi:hypothetical protein
MVDFAANDWRYGLIALGILLLCLGAGYGAAKWIVDPGCDDNKDDGRKD